MKGLNIKGLIKQIKQSKHNFIWSHSDKGHFLTNRHWAITLEILPVEVLVTLLQIFEGARPELDQSLSKYRGTINTNPRPIPPVIADNSVVYEWTEYYKNFHSILYSNSDDLLRIFKGDDHLTFISNNYLHAVEWGSAVEGGGKNRPIVFPEINYMVVPCRVNNHEDLLKIMTMAGDSNAATN